MKPHINFDHSAAGPLDPRVREAMLPWLTEHCGNPSSLHSLGAAARRAVEAARGQVAGLLNARSEEIIFTATGTEANNLALKGLTATRTEKGRHIIVSAVEHSSVLATARRLERSGCELSLLPVDRFGRVDPAALRAALRPDTVLVSIMTANNEVGTIQPIAELAAVARAAGVLFHTDAVAAAGVIPIDVRALGVDALTLAAPTFGGPLGTAALWLRQGVAIRPQLDGGAQENHRRAGTENVPAIVGLGRAAELAQNEMPLRTRTLAALRDRLLAELPASIPRVYVTGHREQRLPGHASFCIEFIEGEGMLLFLDDDGIAVASGSACTSRTLKESHVLISMGLDHALAQGSLMLTLGPENTADEVDCFLTRLPPIVERLRAMSPLYARYRKDPAAYDARQQTGDACTAKR